MRHATTNLATSAAPRGRLSLTKFLATLSVILLATTSLAATPALHPFPETPSAPAVAVAPPVAAPATPAAELMFDTASTAQPIAKPATSTSRVVWMLVTAYCPCTKCCGPRAAGITASGKDVSYNDGHFVAADTDLLAFGSVVRVPGYADNTPVEVIDRGSAIKGNRLDVFFPTHDQALVWGRRWMPVTVQD